MKRGGPLGSDPAKAKEWQQRGAERYAERQRQKAREPRTVRGRDDHPRNAPHLQCPYDHDGKGVAPHCRCGAVWPCPENPVAEKAASSRRKPRRNDSDAQWREDAVALYGEWCRACGARRRIEADHMFPKSQGGKPGGKSDVRNCLFLCQYHHEAKTNGELLIQPEWLTLEQRAYLSEVGWVRWGDDGRPSGRGYKHFTAMRPVVPPRDVSFFEEGDGDG